MSEQTLERNIFAEMGNRYERVIKAGQEGTPVVWHPFNVAGEIFHALDLVPVSVEVFTTYAMNQLPEGIHPYLDLAVERGLPESMCSAQRGTIGMYEAGFLPKPDLIVSTLGGCDPNSKAYEYMSEKYEVPILYLDVPFHSDRRAIGYFEKRFKDLVTALEEMSGRKLKEDRLREVCELANKATELILDINELKKKVPNPVPNIYNLMSIATKSAQQGTQEAVDFYQNMLNLSKLRLAQGIHVKPEEKIRLMFMYTGFYFDPSYYGWFEEEMGVTYLSDLLVFHDCNPFIDLTSVDTMLAGLGEEMFNMPMTRQRKGSWDLDKNWLYDVLYYADTYQVDAMVFSGHAACKQAWGAYRLVAEEARKQLGVPSLRLEGDCWDSRVTPMEVIKGQLAEFFETVMESKN